MKISYYEANKEKVLAYAKEYREKNREYFKEYAKAYREKNPEYFREYQKKNKEAINANRRAYTGEKREKINAQQRESSARLFAENPEKIRAQRKAKKQKMKAKDPVAWNEKCTRYNRPYMKKMVDELSDAYVRSRLVRQNDGSPRIISASDIPQSLVEAKRVQLMILRSLRNEKR